MAILLRAKERDLKQEPANKLRYSGFIPSELYGHGIKNKHIAVTKTDFLKCLRTAGENQVIELSIEGEKDSRNVLINSMEHHARDGNVMHIDFYQVRMDEKIIAEIPINFVGKSEAQDVLGGSLVKNLHHLKIKSLPGKIPVEISVDISLLKTFEDRIIVGDIVLDKEVEIITSAQEVIAVVVPHVQEAAPVSTESQAEDLQKIEVVKKETKVQPEEETTK